MESNPNFHQIAEDRKALRKEAKGAVGAKAKVVGGVLAEVEEEAGKFKVADYGNFGDAKEKLRGDKERMEKGGVVDEESINAEFGGKYKAVADLFVTEAELADLEMSFLLQSRNDPKTNSKNALLLASLKNEQADLTQQIAEIEEREEGQILARAVELVSYKKGLASEGHIAPTPSVKGYLEEIGNGMINGGKVFLHGPTGTGKTSVARFASEKFTGSRPYMVYCSPETRESQIWGKTGIRPASGEAGSHGAIETVDIYGPLTKAMKEGKVIVFDEFTALKKEQTLFLKGVFNKKIGDEVDVPGNGVIKIMPGFQMIFTANLKSEKNPEREDPPPEMKDEFAMNNIKINHTPKNESYDIMLARLMNKDGSIDLSYHDFNITLPKLCEAMEEIQAGYTGFLNPDTARQIGSMDASGKTSSIKDMVMTHRSISAILEDWQTQKMRSDSDRSFIEFLDQKLKTFITFEMYPKGDRILVAKILAMKGFLRTLSETDLGLPPNTLNFDIAKAMRGEEAVKELKQNSKNTKHLSIKEVATLDPFNTRGQAVIAKAKQFVKSKSPDASYSPEILSLNIEETIERNKLFYESKGINLPPDFEEKIKEIWIRNKNAIVEETQAMGYDRVLIIPNTLPDTASLHTKMTEGYNPTFEGQNFKDGGSFQGSVTLEEGFHLLLLHNAEEIDGNPHLLATKGNNIDDLETTFLKATGLSLPEYLVFQKMYNEETGNHLDTRLWTWLPKTKSGSRLLDADWYPGNGGLSVGASDSGSLNGR